MNRFFWIFFTIWTVGCSVEDQQTDGLKAQEGEKAGEQEADAQQGSTTLKGYVASAFDLEVDGQRYADSEDFYTQQLERLETEVAEAGYEGWNLSFQARIGLDDLKDGMSVYIAAVDSRGYAGDTKVSDRGRFEMYIPADGANALYRVRANKRVTVVLTNPEDKKDQVRWCFNFSAIDMQVDVSDPLPVILSRFETRVTRYACSASNQGISIPTRTTAAVPAPAPEEEEPREAAKETAEEK